MDVPAGIAGPEETRPLEEAVPGYRLCLISALHALFFGVEILLPCGFLLYPHLPSQNKISFKERPPNRGIPPEQRRRKLHACLPSRSVVFTSVTPWTGARQAPLSMGLPRQEQWSGLPFPPPGDLSDPGIKPVSLISPASAGRLFTASPTWEAQNCKSSNYYQRTKHGLGNRCAW